MSSYRQILSRTIFVLLAIVCVGFSVHNTPTAEAATLVSVPKSSCAAVDQGDYGTAAGLDCYQLSAVYYHPLCNSSGCSICPFGNCPYFGYLTDPAAQIGSGIRTYNSAAPSGTGFNYLYTVPKPTVATPFPAGLTTMGFGFNISKGNLKYTVNLDDLPVSRTCNKNSGVCTILDDPDHYTTYPCSGMPSGWGCFYVDNSWSDNFNTYYRYNGGVLAHPPLAKLGATCTATAERNQTSDNYTNVKFVVTLTNATAGTDTYEWSGTDAIGSSVKAYRKFVPPTRQSNATVKVTAKVSGQTQTVTATCNPVTPPKNVASGSCIGKQIDLSDGKNAVWSAASNWGSNPTFEWSGTAAGTGRQIFGYIAPGAAGQQSVTVTSHFPDGTTAKSAATACNNVKVSRLTTKCVPRVAISGITGTPTFTDIEYTASLFSGTDNYTDQATFDWQVSTSTQSDYSPFAAITNKIALFVKPGQTGRAQVTGKIKAPDGSEEVGTTVTCKPTAIPAIKTSCSIEPFTVGTQSTNGTANPNFTNVAIRAKAYSGKVDYSDFATFNYSLKSSSSTPMTPLDEHGTSTYKYIAQGETAQIEVTSVIDNEVTALCKDTLKVPVISATCKGTRVTRGVKGTSNYTNVAFTGVAKKGAMNVTKQADFDWQLSGLVDGQKQTMDVSEDGKTIYAYVPEGKTLTATVKAHTSTGDSTNTNNTCSIDSKDLIAASCSADSPIPGFVRWQGQFSFEENGVEYNEQNYEPDSVTWATDKYDVFDGNDPLNNGQQDPLSILNNYDLLYPSGSPVELKNTMTIKVSMPDDPVIPFVYNKNSSIVANGYAAIKNLIAAKSKKKGTGAKTVTKRVDCRTTYVPLSGGTLAQKILNAAQYAADPAHPFYTCSSVGCAIAVNGIVKMASGSPVDGNAATAELVKSLLAGGRFELVAEVGKRPAKAALQAGWNKQLDEAVAKGKPGDIVMSPTEGSNTGHVGIFETAGAAGTIISNSSANGFVQRNFTGSSWIDYYSKGKNLKFYIFRAK